MKSYAMNRNQMSTPGAWLSKNQKGMIDIAGDILTSASAFSGTENIEPELYKLFERVSHTIGNCIPWPEGGNLGGRPWKTGGSPDNFSRKLIACKEIFDKKRNYDTKCVKCKILNGKTLGRGVEKYACIQYWLDLIWANKTWEDFIEINYLQDFVDEKYIPKSFVVGGDKIDLNNKKMIRDTYIQTIRNIISRCYRFYYDGKVDKEILDNIYSELKI